MSTDPTTRRPADSVPSSALARTALQIIDAVVLVLDEDARIQYLNPACEKLTGYEAEELQGRVVFDALVPEDEIRELDMTVSQGIRLLVTTGIAEDRQGMEELQATVSHDGALDLEQALQNADDPDRESER
jgi:PAS domain S-box-containing protein